MLACHCHLRSCRSVNTSVGVSVTTGLTDDPVAGRGLDIKPFSKGIDTGCVVSGTFSHGSLGGCPLIRSQYGRQLTALVLGDIRKLKGRPVRVGDHQGMLVSVDCQKGGL